MVGLGGRGFDGRGLDGLGLDERRSARLGGDGLGLDGLSCGASAREAITYRSDEAHLFSPQSRLNASAAARCDPSA